MVTSCIFLRSLLGRSDARHRAAYAFGLWGHVTLRRYRKHFRLHLATQLPALSCSPGLRFRVKGCIGGSRLTMEGLMTPLPLLLLS